MVWLHGFGETGEVWKEQVPALKKEFRLIIPDLPGSGQSDPIEDMSIEGMAFTVKALLDELGENKVAVIGHSMGGYIALAFAEKYPDRLNSLGLFHSTAYADSEEKIANRRKGIAFIGQYGAFEFLKTTLPNLFSVKTRDERPTIIDEQMAGLRNFSPDALVLYYQAMMQRPDRTVVLTKSTVPVLFIIGEDDNAVPLKDRLEQCHLPEIAYIHVLRRSGHMGMLEESEKANKILKTFLQEVEL